MAKGPRYKVPYRRRREGKTDYRKRLKLLKSRKPRVVVRITNTRVIAQLIEYDPDGDKVEVMITSEHLRKEGYMGNLNNTPACYLTGILFGKKCIEKGYEEGIFDIGLRTPTRGSRVFAFLKGVVESGFEIPHDSEVFPDEYRLTGKHIVDYYESSKDRFTQAEKLGFNPSNYPSHVDEIKAKILGR
jgi:large subunit ribosomal protein L18